MGFQYGATVFPVESSGQDLLQVCDPSLTKVIDFLSFMIRTYANDAVTSASGLVQTSDKEKPIASVIEQVAPIDPDTIARSEQWQFPLFAAWRKSSVYAERTNNWIHDVGRVGVAYILPPLSASQSVRLTSILTAVSDIVNVALNTGHDAAYNSDERILETGKIAKVRLLSGSFGSYDFAGNAKPPMFPAWVGEIELTRQQQAYTTGLTDLAGTDVTITQQEKDDLSTTIAADASIGATSITVGSSVGFTLLDVVRIGKDTARDESRSITGIPDATHLTLGLGLTYAHTLAQADVVERAPVAMISAKTEVG